MGELINLNSVTITEPQIPAAIARDAEVASAIAQINTTGNFGQKYVHGRYLNANTPVEEWGWNYVLGASNTPHNEGQFYRANIALGSGFGTGTFALEIGVQRYNPSRIWLRTQENGVFGQWQATATPNDIVNTIASHVALLHDGNIGVRHETLITTIFTTVGGGNVIALPTGIVADKIVSLTGIAKISGGTGTFLYVPPLNATSTIPGCEYTIYALSSNQIVVNTATFAGSSRVLGAPLRIVIGYLP